MSNENINTQRNYRVIICAVLFGCDDSIIGLNLGKGITIARKSLVFKDHLNDIFELDSMGLRREYVNASLNKDNIDVACIFREYCYIIDNYSAEIYFDKITSEMLTYLDNKIRAIRLLNEGPVRYEKLAVKMVSEDYNIGENISSLEFNEIMPIGEAFDVEEISKLHCDDLKWLYSEMNKIKFPLKYDYVNQAHILYDRSYLVTLPEGEILLITSLEVLFLKSEKGKKECISKRCSTFLFESQEERVCTYKKLRDEYKKRSDYVHEGDSSKISEKGIIFLRECVRRSIIKLLSYPKSKNDLIKGLRDEIKLLDYWK